MLPSGDLANVATAVSIEVSADHGAALAEAQRLAEARGRPAGSAELLLALLRVGGAAARVLSERSLRPAQLEGHLAALRPEAPGTLRQLDVSSRAIARGLGAARATSLHLLLAILRTGGAGMDLLRATGHEPLRVRSVVMRALTGPGRLSERSDLRSLAPGDHAPAPTAAPHSELDGRTPPPVRAAPLRTPPAPTGAPPPRPASTTPTAPAPGGTRRAQPQLALELLELPAPLHPIVHRERELGRLLDLCQAGSGRVLFVAGEPGSGRSALCALLAATLPHPVAVPSAGPSPLTGGSPGSWLLALHEATPEALPILIDGCSVLGGEGGDGPAQILATARAGRRWLLCGTMADLRRFEHTAPELAAAVELVQPRPLHGDDLLEAIGHALQGVAERHGVAFAPGLARTLVRLSPRYPTDRAQPGRALAIADLAAARAVRLGLGQVTTSEVAAVVADAAGTPIEQLLRTDDERFRTLAARLSARVVGHDEARARIAAVLRRSYAGFRGQRPLGSILLLGPTGVGKTETARAIAESLFDDERALVRFDLSEYNEPHAVARLIGSPPGYVGHEEGGQLTEAIRRRPACVLLFDEFEKGSREVLLLLLQVLEDGRLTDGRGRTVDFSSTTVVMTSNLGSELYRRSRTPPQGTVLALARARLPAELWNRIDEVLCYAPLGEGELRQIVARIAAASSARLEAERGLRFEIDDAVVDLVLRSDLDRSLGARPLRRAFQRLVEDPIAQRLLEGSLPGPGRLRLGVDRSGALQVAVG